MKTSTWLVASIFIVGAGGWYWYLYGRESTVVQAVSSVAVSTGSIRTTVKSTGKISPVQTSILSFTKQWTVTKINKKVWEEVQAGEVLAEINAESAYMDIESANLSLSNARNNYDKLFTPVTDSEKLRSENTLSESRKQLTLLESQYQDTISDQKDTISETERNIKILEEKLDLARADLEYTKKDLAVDTTANNLEKDLANALLSITDIERNLTDILKEYKKYAYIENIGSTFYNNFSVRNAALKTDTEALYNDLFIRVREYQEGNVELRKKTDYTYDEIISGLEKWQKILSDMNKLANLIISEYDNTVEWDTFSASGILSSKNAVTTYATSLSSKLSNINSTVATLKNYTDTDIKSLSDANTIRQKEQTISTQENELTNAKANLESLRKTQVTERISKEQDIEKQKNTIALNEASYKDLLKWPENSDLISARNSIASAEISLSKSRLALEDYQIIATFDGVVNDIPWMVGDTTLSTEWILIENKNTYEIALSLDQIDIVKVKAGMPASIVLDAFPKESYTGTVASISAVPTETSGVVSYEAKILLTINRTDVYSKMSATVEVITAEKKNILLIPAAATTSENGKTYVRVSGSWAARGGWRIEITTGISDSGKVEVLSGLTLGQRVITSSSSGSTSRPSGTQSTGNSTRGGFGADGPPWF
jgi:HlyD family secretion protein